MSHALQESREVSGQNMNGSQYGGYRQKHGPQRRREMSSSLYCVGAKNIEAVVITILMRLRSRRVEESLMKDNTLCNNTGRQTPDAMQSAHQQGWVGTVGQQFSRSRQLSSRCRRHPTEKSIPNSNIQRRRLCGSIVSARLDPNIHFICTNQKRRRHDSSPTFFDFRISGYVSLVSTRLT